jgi:predicted RNase H-like HicB family nuclease
MKVTTEVFSGVSVDIEVDTSGKFSAAVPDYEDNPLRGASIEELREKIRKAITKTKAATAIPITIYNIQTVEGRYPNWIAGRGLLHCFLRGMHARTRALLLRDGKGRNFQIDDYHLRQSVARRFTKDEIARYTSLTAAVDEAQARLTTFLSGVEIDPRKAATTRPAADEAES